MGFFKKNPNAPTLPKGYGFASMGGMFVVLSIISFKDNNAIGNLFALLEYAVSIFCAVGFMWFEIARVYPTFDIKRKRTHAVLGALSAFIFTPLMLFVMFYQFNLYFKRYKAEQEKYNQAIKFSDPKIQYYIIVLLTLVIGTCSTTYFLVKHEFSPRPDPAIEKSLP